MKHEPRFHKRHKFNARFSGKCVSCLTKFYEGDTISYSRVEPTMLVCGECADEEDES